MDIDVDLKRISDADPTFDSEPNEDNNNVIPGPPPLIRYANRIADMLNENVDNQYYPNTILPIYDNNITIMNGDYQVARRLNFYSFLQREQSMKKPHKKPKTKHPPHPFYVNFILSTFPKVQKLKHISFNPIEQPVPVKNPLTYDASRNLREPRNWEAPPPEIMGL